ncbi:MAG: Ig-like domain-containing protein [Lachnospiraceae bacterium]|nr:Ig-like domain-containing protein [Lachnospiraceae bacterium]
MKKDFNIINLDETGALPLIDDRDSVSEDMPAEVETVYAGEYEEDDPIGREGEGTAATEEMPDDEAPEETDAASDAEGKDDVQDQRDESYPDEENAKEHVFQGEVSVDTMLLTDISEEIKRDLGETQVIDLKHAKMVGSETTQMIDLDSDLFELPEDENYDENNTEDDYDSGYADSGAEEGYEGEYDDPGAEEGYEGEYDDPGAEEGYEGEYDDPGVEEGYEAEYDDASGNGDGYEERLTDEADLAVESLGEESEADAHTEDAAEDVFSDEDELPEEEDFAEDLISEESGEEGFAEEESISDILAGLEEKHKEQKRKNAKKTAKKKGRKQAGDAESRKSGKKQKSETAVNGEGQKKKSEKKQAAIQASREAKSGGKGQADKNTRSGKASSGKGKKDRTAKKRNPFLGIAVAAILLLAAGMGIFFAMKGSSSEEADAGYMYAVGESLSSIGIAGESGLIAMAEAGRMSQIPEEEPAEEPAGESEGIVPVEVTFTSVEQDLKIKFIQQESRRLVTDTVFEVHLHPQSGDTITFKDEDRDGIIYEKGMKSGDYAVEIAAVEGYVFVGVPDSVNVREKIAYQQIDVAQEIKKASEVNVAAEDTGVSNAAPNTPQVTLPPAPSPSPSPTPTPTLANGDTVEWVESSKTAVSGGSGYKQIDKSDISAPSYANRNTVEVRNQRYAAAGPCPAAPRTLVRTEVTAEPEGGSATATPTPTPAEEASATPTATPAEEASATPTATPVQETAKKIIKDLSLDKSGFNLTVGSTETITAKATMEDDSTVTEGTKFSWSSSDKSIAKVDDAGKVTAVKTGTVTITATYKDEGGNSKSASCMVTVISDPKEDTSSPLKDRSGNQVYVKNSSGSYVEATFSDYYSKSEFYILVDTEYTYTGWQEIDGKTYYFDKNGKKVTGVQTIRGVKYEFGSDGALKKDPAATATATPTPTPTGAAGGTGSTNSSGPVIGIDVSQWNGSIDWNKVKAAGVDYVIIRCGYRGYTSGVLVEDPKFRSNVQGAAAAGLKVGIYFFTQAINEVEAVEEASMCLSLIRGYNITYPVFIDTEFTTSRNGRADGLNKAARSAVCRAFCETIRSGGYSAGVYCSKSWLGPSVDLNVIGGYKIWMAHYVSQTDYTGHYDMWQYSKNGSVSGIQGAVDMDYSYMGY